MALTASQISEVEEVEIDPAGHLHVRPRMASATYPFIYRAGNGLRWEPAAAAFGAAEPGRWTHDELLAHILATVRAEFGEVLHLTERTRWVNVSPEQRSRLSALFGAENG